VHVGHIWKVGRDVVGIDGDAAMLHVGWFGEIDFVNNAELHKKLAADHAIEIGASYQIEFLFGHWCTPTRGRGYAASNSGTTRSCVMGPTLDPKHSVLSRSRWLR